MVSAEWVRTKSKDYKKELYKAQRAVRKTFSGELMSIKSKNPKLFWKMINGCAKGK